MSAPTVMASATPHSSPRVAPPLACPDTRADGQRIAVIVPSYRRPDDLSRCLDAIAHQRRKAHQVIVVMRADDAPTHAVAQRADPNAQWLTRVTLTASGTVAALNAGLAAASADIVAFTDDDAAPRPDWLERTASAFARDQSVGGVGGRDWIHDGEQVESGVRRVVGRLQWFGRSVGNHHLGAGHPREVDFLKGVNMSFRRTAISSLSFDTRLRGTGAQVCNDMAFSLAVRRRGWKLIYDPATAVDHYPAPRFDEDQRRTASPLAHENAAFNYALVVCESVGALRAWLFLVWAVIVGSRGCPGMLQFVRLLGAEGRAAVTKARACIAGTVAGWRMAIFRT